ncbi:hypothetical protein V2W45_1006722 [Cenococcum geophilum]
MQLGSSLAKCSRRGLEIEELTCLVTAPEFQWWKIKPQGVVANDNNQRRLSPPLPQHVSSLSALSSCILTLASCKASNTVICMFASLGNSCRSPPHRGLVPDRAWPNSHSWLKLYRCHCFSIPTVILLIIPSDQRSVITRVLLSLVFAHGPTLVEPASGRDTSETHKGDSTAHGSTQGQCNVFRSCLDVRFLVKASFRPDNACQAISRSAPTPRLGEYEKPCRSLCIPRKPAHRTNSGD